MGNHTAGDAMGRAAQIAIAKREPGRTALTILDELCEPYRGCDAEFESSDPTRPGHVHPDFDSWCDPHPGAGLGMLMVEAFAPNGLADLPRYAPMLDSDDPAAEEAACDAWFREIEEPFSKRYQFC